MLRIRHPLSILAALALLVSCDATPIEPDEEAIEAAAVRVVHGVAGLGPVDVFVGDRVVARDLRFGEATACIAVDPGIRSITLQPAGDPAAAPALTFTPSLQPGGAVTLVAGGRPLAPTVQLLDEDVEIAEGRSALRIVNVAPSLTMFDAFVSRPSELLPVAPVFTQIGFNAATPFLNVPAGPTRLRLTRPGTRDVVFDFDPEPDLVLEEDESRIVVLLENEQDAARVLVLDGCE